MPVEFAGPPLRCTTCGYDLRGLAPEGRCPECGSAFSWSQSVSRRVGKPELPVDAAPGVTCVRCGMLLSGCSSHTHCPRCAAPIWLSLDGDWLCVRDPAWLRRVRRATSLWFWALVIAVLVEVAGLAISQAWNALPRWWQVRPELLVTCYLGARAAVSLLATLLQWSAAFLLTAANPATAGSESQWTLRHLVRVLLLLNIPLVALAYGVWLTSAPLGSAVEPALALCAVGIEAALGLSMIAYARQLCRRLPADGLVRWLGAIFWGFVACAAAHFLQIAAVPSRGWGWRVLYYGPHLARLLLFLLFSIGLAVVVRRLRRELRQIVSPGA